MRVGALGRNYMRNGAIAFGVGSELNGQSIRRFSATMLHSFRGLFSAEEGPPAAY
jgi:hypothetical protein